MIRSISAFMWRASAWVFDVVDDDARHLRQWAAEHEQVLVVVVVRRLGVVEAAGDHDLLVDHHQLVVQLPQVREDAGPARDEQVDVGVDHRLRRRPVVCRLTGVEDAADLHPATGQREHGVVDAG